MTIKTIPQNKSDLEKPIYKNINSQTTFPKADLTNREWFIVDAKYCVLGRLSAFIAKFLNGKMNVAYAPYANNGPGVIVINAEHIKVTGNKLEDKFFYYHTGYPGGINKLSLEKRMEKDPCKVIEKAVERMIRRSPLGRLKMKNLRVYAKDVHPHAGLAPKVLNFADAHKMNKINESLK